MYSNACVSNMVESLYVEVTVSDIKLAVESLTKSFNSHDNEIPIVYCLARHTGGLIVDAVLRFSTGGSGDTLYIYVEDSDSSQRLGRVLYRDWDSAYKRCNDNWAAGKHYGTVQINYQRC